jgi:hypothetical protein
MPKPKATLKIRDELGDASAAGKTKSSLQLSEIEEMTGEGKGAKTKMSIENLTDKELKLRFEQENAASTVTFKRV